MRIPLGTLRMQAPSHIRRSAPGTGMVAKKKKAKIMRAACSYPDNNYK
jgi:deferrochelatase/peroxidase EfeB